MEQSATNRELALFYKPPLLMFELQEEFRAPPNGPPTTVMPSDYIEQLYRLTIWSTANAGDSEAAPAPRARLSKRLSSALRHLIQMATGVSTANTLTIALDVFTNQRVRRQVLADLQAIGLDEVPTDAEAVRQSMEELERLEASIDKLEARRDKILRSIEDRRAGLATRVVANAHQCTDADVWTLVSPRK